MAQSQELLVLGDPDRKSKRETSTPHAEHQHIKTDDQDENEQEPVIMQQPTGMMVLLQQLLDKQDLLLEENKHLKQEMTTQKAIINNLSEAIEMMKENPMVLHKTSTGISKPEGAVIDYKERDPKERAAKQLQVKRMNQLLDSTPFSGSISQEVSDWIEEFSRKCDQLQLDDDQRFSIAVDLEGGNAKLWYDTHKDTIVNWITLKSKLSTYFKLVTGTDQFQLEQKLYNRRRQPNELAMDYCHNVLKLCSKVNQKMDEETRLQHLLKGLNATTQLHMDLKDPSTTEEFVQTLIKYDKWQEEEKPQQRNMTSYGPRRNILNKTMQPCIEQQQQQRRHGLQEQVQQSQYSSKARSNERTYNGCWSCGDMDHYQYECPKNC